jgi:hypothetical protein
MPVCAVRKKLIDRLYNLIPRYTEAIERLGVVVSSRNLVAFARQQMEVRQARQSYEAVRDALAQHRLMHGC